jgi:hypothetical protein
MRTGSFPMSLRRRAGRLIAVAAALVLAAGCAGGDGKDAVATGSPTAASSSAAQPDLASGLLPADAFGPDAAVTAVSPKLLEQGAGFAASAGENLQVSPEACVAAVAGTQPTLDDFGDVAAQTATVGTTVTVEMLIRGGPIKNAVSQLAEAASRCPQARVTSPEFGQATITFQSLPAPDLGKDAAVLQYTVTIAAPDGTRMTLPTLIGAVQDGNRLVMLITAQVEPPTAGTAPDPAAFVGLLQEAYDTQATALD